MKQSQSTNKTPSLKRGSADQAAEPRFLVIGKIIKPHGINGDLRIESMTDMPERFTWLETVYLDDNGDKPYQVEEVRFHKKWVLMKLKGIDDRNEAEEFRRSWLYVPIEASIPLEEDEYFLYQVIGLRVVNQTGDQLGEIVDIIETPANNVFIIKSGTKEILIPDIPEVILDINFDDGVMTIFELPGLIDR